MKKISIFLTLIFAFSFITSCQKETAFSHCELTLILPSDFSVKESEEYDLLLSDGEAAVSLTRLSFEAAFGEGIPDTYTAKGFAAFFMTMSEKSEELLTYGDVPYYTYSEKGDNMTLFYTVTFYRSMNAYFIVAYAVPEEKREEWSGKFLEFSQKAYFNDAPEIKAS